MRLFVSVILAMLLAACGQSGPLSFAGKEPARHAGDAQSTPQDSSAGSTTPTGQPAASATPTLPPPPTSVSPSTTAPGN